MKRAISFVLALVMLIGMLPMVATEAEAAGYYSEIDLSGISCSIISNSDKANYVNQMMKYHILSAADDYRVARNLKQGRSVVFFFEGCSDNTDHPTYSDYNKYRLSAYCAVVQEINGALKIVYENENCSTIPDNPRKPELNKNEYGNPVPVPTVLDGVYNIRSRNHNDRYAALKIVDNSGSVPVIRCTQTTSRVYDPSGGINIHARSSFRSSGAPTNGICSTSYSSTGCFIVGLTNNTWSEYNSFINTILGIPNAIITTPYKDGVWTKCTEGIDKGLVIVDRSQYKEQLAAIYGGDNNNSANALVSIITAYTDNLNANIRTPANLGDDFIAPILNKEHWKIIENNNGIVQTANETGTANQLWRFERQSDGSYKISSCLDGRCLDVAYASSAAGAKICAVESNDSDAQRWYIYEESGGYILKAKCTDCVLDLHNNDPTNGNQLQTYTGNGTGAQIWAIYRGEECLLKAPTLSVHIGDTTSATKFTWTEVYGERCYDIKIWKDKIWEGDAYHVEWGAASGYEITLPAGTYQAYVDANNYFECRMSNVVTFTVAGHTHTYSETVTPPTCLERGYTTYKCEKCKDMYVDGYVDAMGHKFGDWAVTKDPTCTDKGVEQRECENCDHFETREVDVTDHHYETVVTEPTCLEKGFTTYTCADCGDSYVDSETDPTGHIYENGVCTACGEAEATYSRGDIDRDGDVDVDDVLALLWHVLFPEDYPL